MGLALLAALAAVPYLVDFTKAGGPQAEAIPLTVLMIAVLIERMTLSALEFYAPGQAGKSMRSRPSVVA